MSDNQEIQGFRERLEAILEALERLPGRFADIRTPQDFIATEAGREHLDFISMVLLAVGEAFRQIDDKTNGCFLSQYPEIPWRAVIGMRNILAHNYFDVNEEVIFNTCEVHIVPLIATVKKMLVNLETWHISPCFSYGQAAVLLEVLWINGFAPTPARE